MKRAIILFVLFPAGLMAQENCYDGIDNDGDFDVDLNDDECDCGLFEVGSLMSNIPNPSFEEMVCCPSTYGMMSCAEGWIQASLGTSDYFNACDFGGFTELPIPGGGSGYAGFKSNPLWQEYVGTCLTEPLTAGTPYILNFWIASWLAHDLNFAIFGTPYCSELPWTTQYCPTGEGSWTLLGSQFVDFDLSGEWVEVTLTFTPTSDINAVALGGACLGNSGWNHFYIDELSLLDSVQGLGTITQTGSWCDGDLSLCATIDTVGGTWQWYFEGIALVGETGSVLDVMETGLGTYQVVYVIEGTECEMASNYMLINSGMPTADFSFSNECLDYPVDFNDASIASGSDSITYWDWDFGDAGTSTLPNPTHTYLVPGVYAVTLTVTSFDGCASTVTNNVTIFPEPISDFEFEILGESSVTGLIGGCFLNSINFADGSSVLSPGSIAVWYWNFGDGDGSSSTAPSHNYAAPGSYTVTLTVVTNQGCSDSAQMDILMSDLPIAEFTFSNVCLGDVINFTDSSTTSDFGSITNWEWDFDDGETSSLLNPTHTYSTAGTYLVSLTVTSADGCTDTATHEVTIYPIPDSDFEFEINGESSLTGITGGCLTTVYFVDASNILFPDVITDWLWTFGDGASSINPNPFYDYSAPGTYTVTLIVTTSNGCSDSLQKEITLTAPILDIAHNDPSCYGFDDGWTIVYVASGSGDEVFEIKDEDDILVNVDGYNTANLLGGGWYYITVVDSSGCSSSASVFLDEPEALDADLTLSMPVCSNDQNGWAAVQEVINAQGDLTNITYTWNPDPPVISGLGADSLYNLGAGTYTLTINDDFGCSNEITFEITKPDELIFTEIGYTPSFCRLYEYQSGNGLVFASAGGGTPDYNYAWENLATGETHIPTTWGGLNPGDYQITVVDDAGCVLTQIITVDSLNPIADFDVTSAELNGDLEGTAIVCATFTNQSENFSIINDPLADTTFFWNHNHPNSPWMLTHDFFQTSDTCYAEGGEYEVCLIAQNKNGCLDTACKTITVFTPFVISNVNIFTPDGDGINDVFTFDYVAEGVIEFHCVIVNRWGQKLAEIHDINVGWDGTDGSGSICLNGVYFYTYEGKAENNEPFSGQGTLQIVGLSVH